MAGHPDTDGAIEDLKNGDVRALADKMYNVLEEVSIKRYPIIQEIKDIMTEGGALKSMMSGSGPTIFGIFKTYDEARNAKKALWGKYKTVYICTPV